MSTPIRILAPSSILFPNFGGTLLPVELRGEGVSSTTPTEIAKALSSQIEDQLLDAIGKGLNKKVNDQVTIQREGPENNSLSIESRSQQLDIEKLVGSGLEVSKSFVERLYDLLKLSPIPNLSPNGYYLAPTHDRSIDNNSVKLSLGGIIPDLNLAKAKLCIERGLENDAMKESLGLMFEGMSAALFSINKKLREEIARCYPNPPQTIRYSDRLQNLNNLFIAIQYNNRALFDSSLNKLETGERQRTIPKKFSSASQQLIFDEDFGKELANSICPDLTGAFKRQFSDAFGLNDSSGSLYPNQFIKLLNDIKTTTQVA